VKKACEENPVKGKMGGKIIHLTENTRYRVTFFFHRTFFTEVFTCCAQHAFTGRCTTPTPPYYYYYFFLFFFRKKRRRILIKAHGAPINVL
jgi:hypothetical protein